MAHERVRKGLRTLITTYRELRETLQYEKKMYPNHFYDYATLNQRVYNWRFVRALRWAEFFHNKMKSGKGATPVYALGFVIAMRIKNRIGSRIGVEIDINTFDKGLLVHHNGNIVINNGAQVGKDCQLHGDNCIGNRGAQDNNGFPIIGDNVDIGVGAKILGSIRIADGIKIGANAIVINSFEEPGITIVGVPAHKVK